MPDGQLVTDAIVTLVGANPVQQDGIICLHKNTFPECEWRRKVFGQPFSLLLHWADASRFPGDRGWWIEPAPVWCLDQFNSGVAVKTENATLVDFHNNTTNRWRQTNTLRGIVGGGVMVQFDPRFEGQYTDMTKFGTPEWAPAGYEKQWTRHDGWSRWEYWVTPLTAKGVVPWGDPSMDVLIQASENGPQPPSAPLPFVPCPRPLTATPKPPEPPSEGDMTHDDIRRAIAALGNDLIFGAYQRFHDEVLPRDRPMDSVIKNADGTEMWTGDVTTGGAMSIFCRSYFAEAIIAMDKGRTPAQASGDGYDVGIQSYRNTVNPPVQPPVTPGAFQGPIGVSNRDFTVPGA